MRLKPKTVRRLKLLAGVSLLVVGAIFALFVVRRWQNDRALDSRRAEGMSALAAHDYARAVDLLGRYVHHGRDRDADAWLAYAQARAVLEKPDYSHLSAAVAAYRRYMDLRPDDKAQRLVLIKLCNQAGQTFSQSGHNYFHFAIDEAGVLLPASIAAAGPEHLDLLREEGIALAASGTDRERLDTVVARLIEIAPLDLQGQLLRLEVLNREGKQAEARDGAKRLLADHPESPVAQLIAAASLLLDQSEDGFRLARVKVAQTVGLDPSTGAPAADFAFPDTDFVDHTVDILDRLHAFDLSLRVLCRWFEQRSASIPLGHSEVLLARTLARRLWQDGDHQRMERLFSPWPIADQDSEVLAFMALSRQRTAGGAGTIIAVLRSRQDDFRAEAWATVLPIADPTRIPAPLEDSEVLKAVAKATCRQEPVFLVMLGEALAASGRTEDARKLWGDAATSSICAGWAYPDQRIAETQLSEDRFDEAAAAAGRALLLAHDSPQVNALWFEAQAARLMHGSTDGPEPRLVLQTLERAMSQLEHTEQTPAVRATWERLLPVQVLFLNRTGQREAAIAAARASLHGSRRLGQKTLEQLGRVGASEQLGILAECLDAASAAGFASPRLTYERAMELARDGKPEQGLVLLREAASSGTADSRLLVASYLDRLGRPESLKTWIDLGNDFPADITIQKACLMSGSAAGSKEFVETTIERYKSLTGQDSSDDAVVCTARARVLLGGTPSDRDRDQAIGLLAQIVNAQPALAEQRLLLAYALQMSDSARGIRPDLPRATNLLSEALSLEPRNAQTALELARVLQRQGEFRRSRETLIRLAQDVTAAPTHRLVACQLLIAQGDLAPVAIQVLADLVQAQGDVAGVELLATLANAYAGLRRDGPAGATYARLLQHPKIDPETIYSAARWYQMRRDSDHLSACMTRLQLLAPPSGVREDVLARLAEERADEAEANRLFQTAISASPASIDFRRHYISALMARGAFPDAQAIAEKGLELRPGDPTLTLLLEQARAAASGTPDLKPLIDSLAANPGSRELADVLSALETARQRGELDSPDRLLALADKFPSVASLQVVIAQRLVPLSPEHAGAMAAHARELAPGDPRVARAASRVFYELGRWNDMLSAAAAWRSLDTSRSVDSDVAVAQARLNLKEYGEGLAILKPRIEDAAADPKTPGSLAVLEVQTRLLIGSGKEAQARELLTPLLQAGAQVRTGIWARIAAEQLPLANAREWLEQVRAVIPAGSIDEQLALAQAWVKLAERFPQDSKTILAEGEQHLQDHLQSAGPSAAPLWEALGQIRLRAHEDSAAQAAFESAISLDPDRPASLCGLASILKAEHDPARALSLAKKAVNLAESEESLGTLAAVYLAMAGSASERGDQPAAAASYRQASETYRKIGKLRPTDPRPWIQAYQAADRAGDYAGAEASCERLLETPGLKSLDIAAVKNNLAMAIVKQDPPKAKAEKARTLAREAVGTSDEAAFRDTLGWAELQAGNRQAAAQAFRAVIGTKDGDKNRSALIGLATALSSGTPEERHDAAVLSGSIDGKDLDPFLAAKLRRLQSMVDADRP